MHSIDVSVLINLRKKIWKKLE